MSFEHILNRVGAYYSGKLEEHGPVAQGVDWNSEESQRKRFEQLLSVCRGHEPFSIVDYGCGYGALSEVLHERGAGFRYQGYDVSASMIATARERHAGCDRCRFASDKAAIEPADFAVASGVFNVKLDTPESEWVEYIAESIGELDRLGTRGFAFNMLTGYSDRDRMRPDLFYGNPGAYFDHCATRYSRWVALYHDYGLYEFTIVVRKALEP